MSSSNTKFYFGITLLLIFPRFGLSQELTDNDAERRNLKCWECDDSAAGGFCTGDHYGQSALCPSEAYPRDKGVDTLDAYRCLIMKVVDEKTNHTEIMKGCSNLAYDFIKDAKNEFVPHQTKNGCSTTTYGRFILAENEKFYQIRMCFCDKTDCNKFEIDGIGMEGRNFPDEKKGMDVGNVSEDQEASSFAPSFLNSFWLQLCCLIAIGVELGI